jgi:hypothetical protein
MILLKMTTGQKSVNIRQARLDALDNLVKSIQTTQPDNIRDYHAERCGKLIGNLRNKIQNCAPVEKTARDLKDYILENMPHKFPGTIEVLRLFNDVSHDPVCQGVFEWRSPDDKMHNPVKDENGILNPAKIDSHGTRSWYIRGKPCSAGKNDKGEILPSVIKGNGDKTFHFGGIVVDKLITNGEPEWVYHTPTKKIRIGKKIVLYSEDLVPGKFVLEGGHKIVLALK